MLEKITLPIDETASDRVSPLRPDLKWLGIMLGFCVAVFAVLFISVQVLSKIVIANLSIEEEREYFGSLMLDEDAKPFDFGPMNMPEAAAYFADVPVYLIESEEENAYASIGANIFITSGLLENIENKEELLFILAHEKEHILNRDVLVSFSRELPLVMSLEFLGLNFGNSLVDTNKLVSSYFSRGHEHKADEGGIRFLNELELNTACAVTFFERVGRDFEKYTEFVSTHPESKKRLERIKAASQFPEKECSEL